MNFNKNIKKQKAQVSLEIIIILSLIIIVAIIAGVYYISTIRNNSGISELEDNITNILRTEGLATIPVGTGSPSIKSYPINGEIWFIEHLAYIDKNITTLAGDYKLMRSLDFERPDHYYNTSNKELWTTEQGWKPIGSSSLAFTGTFDGQGNKIRNLYINRTTTNIGLFAYMSPTSEIKNVGVEEVDVTGHTNVGALIGQNNQGLISNCYTTGLIKKGGGGNARYFGGLIGLNNRGTIINSYSRASVSGGSYVGGFVGRNDKGSITHSYSTGPVVGSNLGGFCGNVVAGVGLEDIHNFWDTTTSGQTTSQMGTGKVTLDMRTQTTFTNWDFTNTWEINSEINNGYPHLKNVVPN